MTLKMHTPTPMPHLRYRPDIDGLRAVAVLSVILFHAFPESLHGGFIGVDIFFVISGFLISTIIMNGLTQHNFSFIEFYSRRIRRIFPALIIVLITSLSVGWLLLTANEYKALGKYTAGGAGFVANLFFLHDGGYFGGAATAKPLLHLWSLGVEEQFYIVWPILLWAALKLRINRWLILLTFAAISFVWGALPLLASSMAWEGHVPYPINLLFRTDKLAVFYLPQARFWELLVGAALAHVQLRRGDSTRPRNNVAALGAGLIALGLMLITEEKIFPSYWALLPTLGAACIIAAGTTSWFNRMVLSSRPLVAVGMISYPLYLWHWPLLSFAHITLGETPCAWVRAGCVIVAFILAWGTYRFIEKPVRTGVHLSAKAIVLALCMALIGSTGMALYLKGGLPSRSFAARTQFISDASGDWKFPADLIKTSVAGIQTVGGAEIYVNMEKPPQILFLGDSHMQQYAPRLAQKATTKNIPVMFLTGGGCPAIPNVTSKDHYHCKSMIEHFQKILAQTPSIKTIVIGGCWNGMFTGEEAYVAHKDRQEFVLHSEEGKAIALTNLKNFLRTLKQTHRVVFVLDNPSTDLFEPTRMLKNRLAFNGADSLPKTAPAIEEQATLNNELRAIGKTAGATIIDPRSHLCDSTSCRLFDREGGLIYQNTTHLTAHFVTTEADYIDAVFNTSAGTP